MSQAAHHERQFIAAIGASSPVAGDTEAAVRQMDDWLARLGRELDAVRLPWAGLDEHSMFAQRARDIDARLGTLAQAWARRRAALAPAQALADAFGDRIVLLVFGKFNAGKSAFCNLMADRCAGQGMEVRYFRLDAGRIDEMRERFQEGSTETTAQLQGVCLGERLVLLDTPGLHSVTPENAALARQFTDSADGVLWLTSSTSPGQVQELDELARELHRSKPLLPVLTRSDVFDEDEVDGEIRKRLRNKTAQNRAQQEADVAGRARGKLEALGLDAALLKPPVSVSVYAAREQGQTAAAMAEAGFEALYAALLSVVGPALAYKRRKPAEMLLHHLEESVLGPLRAEVAPQCADLAAALRRERDQLEQKRLQLADAMWRSVVPALPGLLERHASSRNVQAVRDAVSRLAGEALDIAAGRVLGDYALRLDACGGPFRLGAGIGYEEITVDGQHLVGISHERLHAALLDALQEHLARLAADAAAQCGTALGRLQNGVGRLQAALQAHEQDLSAIKHALRAPQAGAQRVARA